MILSSVGFDTESILRQNYYGNELLAHYYKTMMNFDDYIEYLRSTFNYVTKKEVDEASKRFMSVIERDLFNKPKFLIPNGTDIKLDHISDSIRYVSYCGIKPELSVIIHNVSAV